MKNDKKRGDSGYRGIIETLAAGRGATFAGSKRTVDAIFEMIADYVFGIKPLGKTLRIPRFGTFYLKKQAAREVVNPLDWKTTMRLPKSEALGFRAAKVLRRNVK